MGEQEGGRLTLEGKAARIARQIGDEEWQKGHTKYALEAWEASDITPAELFEKAQRLLSVPPRYERFLENDCLALRVVAASGHSVECKARAYPGQIVGLAGTLLCLSRHETCKARFVLIQEFH